MLKLNERLITKCEKCVIQIIYSMFVLVNYNMDTFFGVGQVRSEHIDDGYPQCTGGYVYGERTLSGFWGIRKW